MKRILVGLTLSLIAAGQAFAADLGPPPAPRAPAAYVPTVVPVFSWSGVYFGINGGYAFGKSEWTNVPGGPTGDFNVNGGIVGPTLGVNWQSDAWVFGLEGDFDGSWMRGKTNFCAIACETRNTWIATLRGRLGYAADRVLFYATAGGAFGNIEANTAPTFQSETKAGWTAGGGIEAAFANNWTARVEYLFVDLQHANFTGPGFPPGTTFSTTVKLNANLVRAGIMYKF